MKSRRLRRVQKLLDIVYAAPAQLQKVAAVLAYLAKQSEASRIFLAGDSAGGNLVLALLSHILHPHPDVPVVELKQPLASTTYEVLADPIIEMNRQMRKGWVDGGGDPNQVVIVQGVKEAHIGPILDIMTPGAKAKSYRRVVQSATMARPSQALRY
ncbi:hypothetical protein GQ44DRAFT_829147 [Phaeosphaeriaceae sp. PMI808]|nr:hypothetical protein GQ44DRAFT_829147 [Phaeosphaeriaceae sp. PMI808]